MGRVLGAVFIAIGRGSILFRGNAKIDSIVYGWLIDLVNWGGVFN